MQVKLKRRERSAAKTSKPTAEQSAGSDFCCWSTPAWCWRLGGGLAALLLSSLLAYAALLVNSRMVSLERRLLAGEYTISYHDHSYSFCRDHCV